MVPSTVQTTGEGYTAASAATAVVSKQAPKAAGLATHTNKETLVTIQNLIQTLLVTALLTYSLSACSKSETDCWSASQACATGFKCVADEAGRWSCLPAPNAQSAAAAAAPKGSASKVAPAAGTPKPSAAPATKTASDGGIVWRLKGHYEAEYTTAFSNQNGTTTFGAGNGCALDGKLKRVPGERRFRFTGETTDGLTCPKIGTPAASFIVDVLATDGAKPTPSIVKFKVTHAQPDREVTNFSGVYVPEG